jgi:hypothetical protein
MKQERHLLEYLSTFFKVINVERFWDYHFHNCLDVKGFVAEKPTICTISKIARNFALPNSLFFVFWIGLVQLVLRKLIFLVLHSIDNFLIKNIRLLNHVHSNFCHVKDFVKNKFSMFISLLEINFLKRFNSNFQIADYFFILFFVFRLLFSRV